MKDTTPMTGPGAGALAGGGAGAGAAGGAAGLGLAAVGGGAVDAGVPPSPPPPHAARLAAKARSIVVEVDEATRPGGWTPGEDFGQANSCDGVIRSSQDD